MGCKALPRCVNVRIVILIWEPELQRSTAGGDAATGHWIEKLWNSGERSLAAGRYVLARRELEVAEAAAFAWRDAGLLGRIYLPLLESCRQIRQMAVEGVIVIGHPRRRAGLAQAARLARAHGAGVIISANVPGVLRLHGSLRSGPGAVECLGLISRGSQAVMCSPGRPLFAAGLPVLWRTAGGPATQPAKASDMQVILPKSGIYLPGSPEHAMTGESLLLAWEALALKAMSMQAWAMQMRRPSGWPLIAALRNLRRIDMACEPIAINLIKASEALCPQIP